MDGSSPPDPPGFGPGSPGYGPGQPPPEGPQSPAPPDAPQGPPSPDGPQSPAPQGPPSPAPDGPPTPGPQSPGPPGPPPPYAPPAQQPGPESPGAPPVPSYGGPVPPGGWQQPLSSPAPAGARAPLASWGSRLGAYLIDGVIVFLPASILFSILIGGAVGLGDEDEVEVAGVFLAILGWMFVIGLVVLFYATLTMSRSGEHNGQTWGKQLVGIRAVRDSGEPWTFWPAAVREVLLKILAVIVASSVIPVLPWFLNFFWPLWDDQNRALHDMAASSHVVKA